MISYDPDMAAAATGVEVDAIKEAIRTDELHALRAPNTLRATPLVLHAELERWVATLPAWHAPKPH